MLFRSHGTVTALISPRRYWHYSSNITPQTRTLSTCQDWRTAWRQSKNGWGSNRVLTNPFIEGVILVVLGLACYLVGYVIKVADLNVTGQVMITAGVGYAIGRTVQAQK